MSKGSYSQPHTGFHDDGEKPDVESTKLPQEIEFWEKTYRKRFARNLIIPSSRLDSNRNPWFTFDPLWGLVGKPGVRKLLPGDLKFCFPRYLGPPLEPFSAELKARTRQELVSCFNQRMEPHIREHVRSRWLAQRNDSDSLSIPVVVPYLNHGDALPPELLRENCVGTDILSKITAVYFEPGFMQCFGALDWEGLDDETDRCPYYGNGCGYIARAMLAAWQEVHHYNGEQLENRQQYRWLANAVALEGHPGPHGDTEGAIRTHQIICEKMQDAQDKPVSSGDPYTWVEHGFEMGPIYRSVIILLDRQQALGRGRGENEAETCDILFERCSVLLVRTGDEDHLSAPIDFSTLTDAGMTLPLARSEAALVDPAGMPQVARVRLRTAVQFVLDLERREINASSRLTARKNVLDADMLREAERWAEDAIAHAESNGSIDGNLETWRAVRLAQAHLNGDRCGLESEPVQDYLPQVRHW